MQKKLLKAALQKIIEKGLHIKITFRWTLPSPRAIRDKIQRKNLFATENSLDNGCIPETPIPPPVETAITSFEYKRRAQNKFTVFGSNDNNKRLNESESRLTISSRRLAGNKV